MQTGERFSASADSCREVARAGAERGGFSGAVSFGSFFKRKSAFEKRKNETRAEKNAGFLRYKLPSPFFLPKPLLESKKYKPSADPLPPTILLIEDEPEQARALVALIKAQRWRISLATGAQSGYARAQVLQPSLILLDVRMPQMDGFALCRLLKEAPSTRHIPVIFLTAAKDVDHRLAGLGLGGVDYITKPYDPREVQARIKVHLELSTLAKGAQAPVPKPAGSPTAGPGSVEDTETVLLQAAVRFIDAGLEHRLSLAEIARAVGTYEKRLSQLFRQRLGSTVFGFIQQARLRRAAELLAGTPLSVQDVAAMVGFQNAANFATAFRKDKGMSPSEYRAQQRP